MGITYDGLESPVIRVAAFDTPYPPSAIEHDYLPSLDRILDAVDRTLGRRSSRDELASHLQSTAMASTGAAR